MSKIKIEIRKSLLQMIEMKIDGSNSSFNSAIRNKNYYKIINTEIEELMDDYKKQLILDHENDLTMTLKESKIIFESLDNIGKLVANIWISYLDCYNIILVCEIKSPKQVVAKCTKKYIIVDQSNKRVQVPKQIIDGFIADLNSN